MHDILRRKAEEVFQQVADLPRDQRPVVLEALCADEPNVRADVESLLAHMEEETIDSLDTAIISPAGEVESVGQKIGPYKLLQLIGEGGFGSVYMAEQEQPVRRKVALKIIKLGMDTRQVIARFEAERQALALMEHANIARVLDAGSTDTGRPYFVMELVHGIPITEYCDRNSLATRERLELFMQVCGAVQHAHQKGIIHRDIKPSNVLVTMYDGTPVPKVIDFGIAKATSQRLTDRTLFTEFMQFIGTPQYMSPEQAEMSGLDVDTRTDLYSLGVLLYELLTGTTPFEPGKLRDVPYTEIQRIIREEDPPTPSRRLSTLGERLTQIAKSRRAEPRTLSRLIRGELDWIVMKALEKDRTRRYDTAAALTADIRHHLNDEPVSAGPPGAGYKVRKFIRRHHVAVAVGLVVIAALVSGLALATTGFVQASFERDRALAAERLSREQAAAARAEAEAAKAINAFFNDMLASVDPMQVRMLSAFAPRDRAAALVAGGFARDVSVAEMVRQAAGQLTRAFSGKPELEAASRETLGMTLRGLGLFADARPQLREALDIRRRALGDKHADTLRSALALGDLELESGSGGAAEPLVREAHDGMLAVHGQKDPRTLCCAAILAQVLSDQGKYKESEELFSQTFELQKGTLGLEDRDTLATMWRWSFSCLSQWRLAEGERLALDLNEIADRTLDPDDSLNILSKPLMGWCYLTQYRYAEAESILRPGLEQCRRILGTEHPFTYMTLHGLALALQGADVQETKERLYREALAGLRISRGRLHWHTISATADFARWLDRRGRFAEAERLFRDVWQDWARSLGEQNSKTLSAMSELAGFLERIGKLDQAVNVHRERLASIRRHYEGDLTKVQSEAEWVAQALARMGRVDEARALTTDLLKNLHQRVEELPDDPLVLNNYAWALLTCVPADLRDVETATALAEKAVAIEGEMSSPILDTLALAYHLAGCNVEAIRLQKKSLDLLPAEQRGQILYAANLVRYLLKQGDTAAADQYILDGIEMFRQALGADNPLLAPRFGKVAAWLAESGQYSMAEQLLLEAVELNREVLGAEHELVASSLKGLADVYCAQGKYELCQPAYRAALEMYRRLLGDDDVVVANTMLSLGISLYHGGDAPAGEAVLRDALDVYQRLEALEIPAALTARCHLAQALTEQGQLGLAEPLARDVLGKNRELFGDNHPRTALALNSLGRVLVERGAAAEAQPLLRDARAVHRALSQPSEQAGEAAEIDGTLGQCLTALGRFEEAEPLLLESYRALRAAKGERYVGTRAALRRIIDLYDAWGRPDEARRWQAARAP